MARRAIAGGSVSDEDVAVNGHEVVTGPPREGTIRRVLAGEGADEAV